MTFQRQLLYPCIAHIQEVAVYCAAHQTHLSKTNALINKANSIRCVLNVPWISAWSWSVMLKELNWWLFKDSLYAMTLLKIRMLFKIIIARLGNFRLCIKLLQPSYCNWGVVRAILHGHSETVKFSPTLPHEE